MIVLRKVKPLKMFANARSPFARRLRRVSDIYLCLFNFGRTLALTKFYFADKVNSWWIDPSSEWEHNDFCTSQARFSCKLLKTEFKEDLLNADSAIQALKKCTAKCGYDGTRRTVQRARQELKGRTNEDYYKQYRELEDYLKAMAQYNPGSQYKLNYIRDNSLRRRFKSVVFAHGGLCRVAKKIATRDLRVFSMDTSFISSRKVVQQLYIFTGSNLFQLSVF